MYDNNLVAVNPELAKEWHPTKNGNLLPQMVTAGSKKKVWWNGTCGHEWEAQVNSRNHGHGCPFCTGKKVLPGFNDLFSTHPILAAEWHPTKNGELMPTMISSGTERKVWWKGYCGHVWEASPKSRRNGNGCPICSKRKQSSFPEQAIFFYVKQVFPDAINSYRDLFINRMELDVFIPSLSIGIEYDGQAFHNNVKSQENDQTKYDICKNNGIKLIRIREIDAISDTNICDKMIRVPHRYSFSDLDKAIKSLLCFLDNSIQICVDTKEDEPSIKAHYYYALKEQSVSAVRPDLVAEWHPTKNGILAPDMFSKASGDKVWWRCKQGHEWEAEIKSRFNGNNCPYCSGKKRLVGYNDLATVRPDLAAEWHPTKNGLLTPSMVQSKSKNKVWWCCKEGHEWEASIPHRSSGSGCPYCWGRYAIQGQTDLETLYPDIASLWHPTKNEKLLPSMVTTGSEKKAWWLGHCGHEWQRVVKRMVFSANCPYCSGRKVLLGYNDLFTTNPEISQEWHSTKNGNKTPVMYSKGSGVKVWWKCVEGHEWIARIADRSAGSRCPICAKKNKEHGK